jgi:hypothetical protein
MKTSIAVTVLGLILLYFVDAALKIQLFSWEMLAHSAIRFFTGFILIGIGVLYAHRIKLLNAGLLVLALVIADDVVDYYRKIDSFSFEDTLHGVYMLLWGSVMGYILMKIVQDKMNKAQ